MPFVNSYNTSMGSSSRVLYKGSPLGVGVSDSVSVIVRVIECK